MPRATLRQRAHGVRRALCICVRVRTQPRTMPSTRILSPFHVHSLSPPSFVRHPFDYSVTRIAHAIFNEGALDTRRRSRQFIPAILAVLAPALASFSQLSHRSPSREPFGMQIARNAACASSISGRRNPVCSQADPTERSPRWLGIPQTPRTKENTPTGSSISIRADVARALAASTHSAVAPSGMDTPAAFASSTPPLGSLPIPTASCEDRAWCCTPSAHQGTRWRPSFDPSLCSHPLSSGASHCCLPEAACRPAPARAVDYPVVSAQFNTARSSHLVPRGMVRSPSLAHLVFHPQIPVL